MLEIDSSFGEGGGQIIRSALALSAVTGTEIRLTNIRANRPKPGLRPQHITAIKAVAKLCNGTHSELKAGTSSIDFHPGRIQPGKFSFDIGTAGSITLVLQACLLPALFYGGDGEFELKVRGGTDVPWSPPFDYFRSVFLKHLKRLGARVEVRLIDRGYYPKGGGEVSVKITPGCNYNKLDLTNRGKIINISGVIHSRLLPPHVHKRILKAVNDGLKNHSPMDIDISIDESSRGPSPGTGLVLTAEYENSILGASALGEKGLPAERVGAAAVANLLSEMECPGAVDIHAADQLVPYLGLVGGELTVREHSLHAKTNIWLVEQFLDKKFIVSGTEEEVKIIV